MGEDRLRHAFQAVPRQEFLRAAERARAGHDGPLPIGHGQTNSQPRTVATMLGLLDVRPGHRVLDVGSGSGWTTALLAALVGPEGRVLGLEVVPEIASWGADNLRAHLASRTEAPATDQPDAPATDQHGPPGEQTPGHATIELAEPGTLGRAGDGPWDRILVSAMARTLPEELVDQLADGGRMVCPVDGEMTLVERHGTDRTVTGHGAYRFVPLVGP